jgi:hypothetical protein
LAERLAASKVYKLEAMKATLMAELLAFRLDRSWGQKMVVVKDYLWASMMVQLMVDMKD